MTRPTPESPYPYTRSAAAILANLSNPVVKRLGKQLLKKRSRGTGNFVGYNFDDVLRMKVAKELLHVGVNVASIHSLFAAIEKDWPRLRQPRTRVVGACLVLFIGQLGPNSPTGRAYLTTTQEAVDWLKSKQTVVVIDINALIEDLEQRTGQPYTTAEQDAR